MIHRYSLKGKNFLLDVNSGSVHVLDDISYKVSEFISPDMTKQCPEFILDNVHFERSEIIEAYDELYNLFENKLIFSDDNYIDDISYSQKDDPVKALCLHVSHDCNLRCGYCFASTGDFGTGRKIMSVDVAKTAIDFVVEKSRSRKNIEIDFFGGEPLIAFDTVKETVSYARSLERRYDKRFRFTITTNGVLLNQDAIGYINENMDNVVLSIDGRAHVNDNMRKTIDGKGSYDTIMPKFQKLIDGRSKDYYARGTFTKYNLDFCEDVLHIADCGFKHLSVEPVITKDICAYSLTAEDLPYIFEEYEKLCDIILHRNQDGKTFNFFHFLIDLDQGPCVIKRLKGCGSGCEYVAITPEGDIYPCHQFVGKEEFRQGNVVDKTFNSHISDRFSGLNIYTKPKCNECWAKFYCSGGCAAANYLINGDLAIPYDLACDMEKKRLECAIYLKYCQNIK